MPNSDQSERAKADILERTLRGEKEVSPLVARDGIEPPTHGFSDHLGLVDKLKKSMENVVVDCLMESSPDRFPRMLVPSTSAAPVLLSQFRQRMRFTRITPIRLIRSRRSASISRLIPRGISSFMISWERK